MPTVIIQHRSGARVEVTGACQSSVETAHSGTQSMVTYCGASRLKVDGQGVHAPSQLSAEWWAVANALREHARMLGTEMAATVEHYRQLTWGYTRVRRPLRAWLDSGAASSGTALSAVVAEIDREIALVRAEVDLGEVEGARAATYAEKVASMEACRDALQGTLQHSWIVA